MSTEEKKMNENMEPKTEEQGNQTPDGNQVQVEKKHPIKDFFGKHGKKIGVGLGVAGAVGVGIVADRLGFKLGGRKKGEEEAPTTEA